jgi:B12-binding domain/radical SAM domain protein
MDYDVVLIHPPAIYDFRKKPIFPGPIAYTVSESTEQFMIPPIGQISIAAYLERNGYRTMVDNLCERMVTNPYFEVERYLKTLSARVYAIGLHWCVHSQGAIEIAKLCKKFHPDAAVVLGGLTATIFHKEILLKYPFVDAVIRGEAEKPFLYFLRALEKQRQMENVPNLTYRDKQGKISIVPLMQTDNDLDEYEFTRLDLIKPRRTVFSTDMPSHWMIPVCRGCIHNCATCGGSAYSYRVYFGRRKPAFRSPEKIVEDLKKLKEQGVDVVFLFQDPRMGGKAYWKRLMEAIRQGKIKPEHLTMELFSPADEEYLKALSEIDMDLSLSISPESGKQGIRINHGRKYTNDEIIDTIKLCKSYGITLGIHSMIALADDTPDTIKETWASWGKICDLNQEIPGKARVSHAFGPMILLDPGSPAFDFPDDNGYRPIFKTLEDYITGLSLPAWHQWVSYETRFLDRDSISKLIIDSIEYSINLREKYGLYSHSEAERERLYFVATNRLIIKEVNEAMNLDDENQKLRKLQLLKEFLNKNMP